jgi:C4-dicarboxylate-specific signal transduction histidine kinase
MKDLFADAGVDTIRAISASFAHEINQPLSAIQMHAQACVRWLSKSPPDINAAVASAGRAARAGRYAAAVLDRMHQQAVLVEPVNIREQVDEAVAQLEDEIRLSSVTVRVEVDEDLPLVRADRVAVQQVLINLIRNGLQAMQDVDYERELQISLRTPATGQVRLQVRDTGTGIAADDMNCVFDPFFTTKTQGMGLGLAICRSLIEDMGGALSAQNCSTGGAIFECSLPALADA